LSVCIVDGGDSSAELLFVRELERLLNVTLGEEQVRRVCELLEQFEHLRFLQCGKRAGAST
jgi:hypothetical protein